ncbi:MAG: putative toxin-antitoxin system toxin component, PIN family [Crocosphaera sp.]
MNKLKFVINTNIIISAFLFKNSKPRQALELAKNQHIILLSSNIIQEIKTVIQKQLLHLTYVELNMV